jgi:hypothetical protein
VSEKKPEKKRETSYHKKRPLICTPSISRRISLIIYIILAGFIIAMMTYGGTFLFWRYPFSDLGTLYTVGQQQFNITSLLFFDLTMIASSLLMMQIGLGFTSRVPFRHKRAKQILSFTCSIGFFLIIAPYPIVWTIHIIGATLAVGSLWGLAILFSIEVKDLVSTPAFLFCQILLHGGIISYAILYIMRLSANEIAQKLGIICLMIVFWFTTRPQTRRNLSSEKS